MKAWVEHVAIRVQSLTWYQTFLQQVFGMEITQTKGDAEDPQQIWLGGFQLTKQPDYCPEPDHRQLVWHIAVAVENPDETAEKMQKYPSVKPYGDPVQKNWFCLPDGLVIELVPFAG